MKRIFISCALFLCTISLSAQTKMSAKEAAVKIADRILDSTTYEFKNTKTGEVYKSVKKLPLSMDVKVACKYNNWHYTNGVTNIALMELADKVGDQKYDKGRELVQKLLAGTNIALITDAGTPGISDPGEELVKMAYEAGIEVTSLPGACACVTALTLSGLSTRRFVFEAFLPPDKKEHKLALERLKNETRTMIVYEAPHHLLKTLRELLEILGNRRLTLCRELTKKHETAWQTTIEDAITRYEQEDPKGECVLVIEGRSQKEIEDEAKAAFEEISIEEHMKRYEDQGIARKEAMKLVAKDRGVTKRDIYQYLLGKE